MDFSKFKHVIKEKVKFHEVDLLGVCNNAVYFNYFEDARIEYVKTLKELYGFKKFLVGDSFFIMVHNECDYKISAHLDDELKVFTRIEFIKKSSFGFKHMVYRESTNDIIAIGAGVVVHINKTNNSVEPLPEEFYEAVKNYEENVKIIKE